MRFVICLHNHQPEGTPPEALEEAYQKAYLPTLKTIAEHPSVKVVLCNSGCLLENLLLEKEEYGEIIRRLLERGQLELLSSAIYEPILPAISERDRVAQIRASHDLIERSYGVRPRGMWLPERVWEPSLPRSLVQAGVEYLPLDDAHFHRVGINENRLFDTYLTDDEGMPLRVFPATMRLRYMIPFAKPEEAVAHLLRRRAGGAKIATFADDGEKLGFWPGTYETVQEGRWLSRFFHLIEQEQHRIRTCTFAEFADSRAASGYVYLPAAAYPELLEWSLPPGSQRRFHELKVRLEQEGDGGERMLGAGFWRNFLVRYPESNWMHKRGLDLETRLRRIEETGGAPEPVAQARTPLWKAQCNCAYWHGVFGGLYHPHLRAAVHEHQLAAWQVMDGLEHGDGPFVRLSHRDINMDGEEEVCLENRHIAMIFTPRDGGALVSLDLKAQWINLLDTLARREEAYHRTIRERKGDRATARSGNIHAGIRINDRNVASLLRYDPYPLYSLRDHILPSDLTVRSLQELRTLTEPPACTAMSWERVDNSSIVVRGAFRRDGRPFELERHVTLVPDEPKVRIRWKLRFPKGLPDGEWLYGTEWTLAPHSSGPTPRSLELNGSGPHHLNEEHDSEDVSAFALCDAGREFKVGFRAAPSSRLVQFPVETVSLCETGVERIVQGGRLFLIWPLNATGNSFQAELEVTLESGRGPEAR